MSIAADLTRWAVSMRYDDLPAEVTAAARAHLLDGVGCLVAAARTRAATEAVTVARGLGGPPEATLIGTQERLSAPAAAFANGTLVHALDFDDTHAGGLVHASAVVLPAVFAISEQTGANGEETLAAAVVGYEAICRIGMASPHGFHARGLHATKVAGVFAAALVTSRLLGLDKACTANALGIAGSSAGGLLEFLATGASTKQLHPGAAAMSGIIAARLAAAGATGPDTVFEGVHGIYAAMSARPSFPDSIVDGLGSRWETTRIGIKAYPCCQLSHASIKAAAALLNRLGGQAPVPGDIEEVVAWVHPDSIPVVGGPASGQVMPRTTYDAKFSLPWTVAAMLVDGDITVDTFTPESVARAEVAALARRVRIVPEPSARAAADASGHVTIVSRDGQELTGRHDELSSAAGSASGPIAALSKLAGNLGGDRGKAADLTAAMENLGQYDVPDFLLALAAPARTAA